MFGDLVLRVEDLEDALRRRASLRHQVDDEAELAHREEHVRQVQAELLPLAEGQRAADDLPSAEVQDRRLAEVGDQEDDREQERERAADFQLLLEHGVGRPIEARLLVRLAGERLTTFRPATFSCSTVFSALRRIWTAMNSGWAIAAEHEEHHEGDRQDRQDRPASGRGC